MQWRHSESYLRLSLRRTARYIPTYNERQSLGELLVARASVDLGVSSVDDSDSEVVLLDAGTYNVRSSWDTLIC